MAHGHGSGVPALCPLKRAGNCKALLPALQEPGHKTLMLEPTACKAHQARSRAQKKEPPAPGFFSRGPTINIHALCDSLGSSLRLKLAAGNRSGSTQRIGLVQGLPGQKLLAGCQSLWHRCPRAGGDGQNKRDGHSTQSQSQEKTGARCTAIPCAPFTGDLH